MQDTDRCITVQMQDRTDAGQDKCFRYRTGQMQDRTDPGLTDPEQYKCRTGQMEDRTNA